MVCLALISLRNNPVSIEKLQKINIVSDEKASNENVYCELCSTQMTDAMKYNNKAKACKYLETCLLPRSVFWEWCIFMFTPQFALIGVYSIIRYLSRKRSLNEKSFQRLIIAWVFFTFVGAGCGSITSVVSEHGAFNLIPIILFYILPVPIIVISMFILSVRSKN